MEYRKSLMEERCREVNRLQKILEGANIKLDSVVKDITGKSARKLLQRIIDDDIPDSEEVSILKNKTAFYDLGSDYYDSFNRDER